MISTVRSRKKNLAHDAKFALGFLHNPKRLNVAVSRARALLVIVGNAELLSIGPNWRQMLQYFIALNAYEGPPINFQEKEEEEEEEMQATIRQTAQPDQQDALNIDTPWREE